MGRITAEYRERMYDVLGLYARPYDAAEPVICVDEKSKQLLEQTRRPLPASPGQVEATRRRTKADFVAFVPFLALEVYAHARKIHLVMDNLNTHFRASFEEVLGQEAAATFLSRLPFHYTPKHASWLNMAEIEIGILDRQCTGRRMGQETLLRSEVLAWQQRRNLGRSGIEWKFTRQDADQKLSRHYVT